MSIYARWMPMSESPQAETWRGYVRNLLNTFVWVPVMIALERFFDGWHWDQSLAALSIAAISAPLEYLWFIKKSDKVRLFIAMGTIIVAVAVTDLTAWHFYVRRHDVSVSALPVPAIPIQEPDRADLTKIPNEPRFIDPPAELRFDENGKARSFVVLMPSDLRRLFDEKTENQRLAYVGKWVSISGSVENSSTNSFDGRTTVTLFPWTAIRRENPVQVLTAFLTFDKGWKDKLAFLQKGDLANAVCAIGAIEREYLHLQKCERFDQ